MGILWIKQDWHAMEDGWIASREGRECWVQDIGPSVLLFKEEASVCSGFGIEDNVI